MISADGWRLARHESVHVVAAYYFGGSVEWSLWLDPKYVGKQCGFTFTNTSDLVGHGAVTLAPYFDDPAWCGDDVRKVEQMIAQGVPGQLIVTAAMGLWDQPEFRRKVRVVETALVSRPVLSRDEIEELLQERKS